MPEMQSDSLADQKNYGWLAKRRELRRGALDATVLRCTGHSCAEAQRSIELLLRKTAGSGWDDRLPNNIKTAGWQP